jgi:nucleoside-diphosphate-sugar epimerase
LCCSKTMKIAVTGSSGFVGSAVVREALSRGHVVVATVRDASKWSDFLFSLPLATKENLTLVSADVEVAGSLDEAFRGCEVVIHCAAAVKLTAPDPQREIVDVAVNGTRNALESALKAKVRRFVLTSSLAAVVGDAEKHDGEPETLPPVTEENWNKTANLGNSPYELGKTQAERFLHEFVSETGKGFGSGLEVVAVCPGCVFGPVLHASHVAGTSPQVARDLIVGTFPALPRLGFPCVDVRDVAALHLVAAERPAAEVQGHRFIAVSSPSWLWFKDMADALRDRLKLPITARKLPNFLMYVAAVFDKRLSFGWLGSNLGRSMNVQNAKAVALLGRPFISATDAVVATGESIIALGLDKK